MSEPPAQLHYTAEHEWVDVDGDVCRIGITDYAQQQLGDVVYIDLPQPGAPVEKGQSFGEIESTKSVSDLYAPVSGTIASVNEALNDQPELVNADPYGEGWLVTISAADVAQFDDLLDAQAYAELTD